MKCKFCGKELENGQQVCKDCAQYHKAEVKRSSQEENSQRSLKDVQKDPEHRVETKKENRQTKEPEKEVVSPWKIVAATVVCMILLAVLLVVVINSITGRNWPFDEFQKETTTVTTAPTTPTEALGTAEDLGMTIEGFTDIAVYAVDDTAVLETADVVIARVGDYELTNGLLQIFYWTEFSEFVSEATSSGYDLVSTYNLDIYKPLSEQKIQGYDVTWEQYFLHNAMGTWWQYATVNMLADEAGYELTEEEKASLANVIVQLEEEAVSDGFADVDALIDERLGTVADVEDYKVYMELTARGDMYYAYFQENYVPTDAEVQEFFELNTDYYSYYGITLDSGKVAAVRHVLIQPEGCEFDDYNYVVATDEQWEACRVQAQALLDEWVADGASEEAFAELANTKSLDSDGTDGGLYEGVYAGQMVEAFDAWVFDESRQSGDYGLVKTEYGYHLMYFVSISENDAWYDYAYNDAITYGYGFNKALSAAMEANALVPSLDKVAVSDLAQPVPETTEEETGTTDPTETTAATE